MTTQRKFSCVVAVAEGGGIGKNNTLPWRLKADLKFFSKLTSGVPTEGKQNAVIMGRKTWESIPAKYRPLPHRMNILLSKNLSVAPTGATLCSSLQGAFDLLSTAQHIDKVEKIFVIGGAAVYKEALQHPAAHRLYITHVLKDFDCDVHFPEFDKTVFRETSDPDVPSGVHEDNGIKYEFKVYQRDI
ncbi:dihydrofolate reductase [Pocillopora verrucosa]|uniref:dihydrofolate reductase n=1 Tax=Pocillopora verrucosa TaxID=203993 RepID=UPI002797C398|nr:dihydrofolate reductase-like [Pocillopora verrucosa]